MLELATKMLYELLLKIIHFIEYVEWFLSNNLIIFFFYYVKNLIIFRNANNVREILIEDKCFQIDSYAFATVQKVDFLSIKGACFIHENTFYNATQIYNLNIIDSTLDIKKMTFAQLHHVNQVYKVLVYYLLK